MLATDAKMQKMEPDPIPFMTDKSFRLSVQWPLVLKEHSTFFGNRLIFQVP